MPRVGLDPEAVTTAAAAVIDEVGSVQFSMGMVAERVGVKTPSLYKHVSSQADLAHRVAVLAANELGDAIGNAVQGRAGGEALAAAAQALRSYVKDHPGRYTAMNSAHPTGVDDPFIAASQHALKPLAAVLRGYALPAEQEIHALRMLRSMLHGYISLEMAISFQYATDLNDSFAWMVDFVDHGLRSTAAALGHDPSSSSTPGDSTSRRLNDPRTGTASGPRTGTVSGAEAGTQETS